MSISRQNLWQLDAIAQAELVASGDITASELLEISLTRIEKLNPKLNAVVSLFSEQAKEKAEQIEITSPFSGVPFLLKDLSSYGGQTCTFGSRAFTDFVPEKSTTYLNKVESAGLVSLGKTNTPEFGLLPTTEPEIFGACRNPWDLSLDPGGSSGGAAAAVAAGFVPMAQGGDGGGSLRIPASACGLFGLKLSRGRCSHHPNPNADGLGGLHVMTRSVRDSAAFLDITCGTVSGDRWHAPVPKSSFSRMMNNKNKCLKIGVANAGIMGTEVDEECQIAVEKTAKLCEKLGHDVIAAKPKIVPNDFIDGFLGQWMSGAANAVFEASKRLGIDFQDLHSLNEYVERWTLDLAQKGINGFGVLSAYQPWSLMQPSIYQLCDFLEDYDVLIMPVIGSPPIKSGVIVGRRGYDEMVDEVTNYAIHTTIANAAGIPAMSVPTHWSSQNIPIGTQCIAGYGKEGLLLNLAGQFEKLAPWSNLWPREI